MSGKHEGENLYRLYFQVHGDLYSISFKCLADIKSRTGQEEWC